jgi:hypothetical protein
VVGAGPASMLYMGIPIVPLVLLLVLLIEHSIMQRDEGPNFTGKTFAKIFGFSLLEVVKELERLAYTTLERYIAALDEFAYRIAVLLRRFPGFAVDAIHLTRSG